jgi:hypothetical protein
MVVTHMSSDETLTLVTGDAGTRGGTAGLYNDGRNQSDGPQAGQVRPALSRSIQEDFAMTESDLRARLDRSVERYQDAANFLPTFREQLQVAVAREIGCNPEHIATTDPLDFNCGRWVLAVQVRFAGIEAQVMLAVRPAYTEGVKCMVGIANEMTGFPVPLDYTELAKHITQAIANYLDTHPGPWPSEPFRIGSLEGA